MTIRRLTVHNFKSHRDSTLLFEPVTTLRGLNHHGKTNLVVAMRLVMQHEDWPERFIAWGAMEAWIEIETDDGTIVRRSRTMKSQSIKIQRGGKVESFTGMTAAEPYVRKALGLNKVELVAQKPPQREDLNFVPAMARPRLLLDSPALVQKQVAGIVGGLELEEARVALAAKLRKAEDRLEHLQEDLAPREARLGLDEARLSELQAALAAVEALDAEADEADDRLDELERLQGTLASLAAREMPTKAVQAMSRALKQTATELAKMKSSVGLIEELGRLAEMTPSSGGPSVEALEQARIEADTDLREMAARVAMWRELDALEDQELDLNAEEVKTSTTMFFLGKNMGEAAREIQDALKEIGRCPTCGLAT